MKKLINIITGVRGSQAYQRYVLRCMRSPVFLVLYFKERFVRFLEKIVHKVRGMS